MPEAESALSFNAGAGSNNPEQVEAILTAKIRPFLDLLFNRAPVKLPENVPFPAFFRRELEQLDADIARGELGQHFHIDIAGRKITTKTGAAEHFLTFIDTFLEGFNEDGTGCRQ